MKKTNDPLFHQDYKNDILYLPANFFCSSCPWLKLHCYESAKFFIKREGVAATYRCGATSRSSEYLVDDCFAIRCDVEVIKMLSAAAAAEDPAVIAHDLERLALPCTCDDDKCKRLHLPRAVEPASPPRHCDGAGAGVNTSPETAGRACVSNKDDGLRKHRAVEAPPPQPSRRRRGMAAWFRLFPGAGKSETVTAERQATCTALKKPLLSEIN
ncbi:unnamed protein product [Urochloa humidicola]